MHYSQAAYTGKNYSCFVVHDDDAMFQFHATSDTNVKVKLTSRMILTASRVFPSFRAHIANRRLMYTRMFVSRPAFYNHIAYSSKLTSRKRSVSNQNYPDWHMLTTCSQHVVSI